MHEEDADNCECGHHVLTHNGLGCRNIYCICKRAIGKRNPKAEADGNQLSIF